MVLIGSRFDVCAWCRLPDVYGEFWLVTPRVRQFICAACLRRAAAAIDQARPRVLEEDEHGDRERPRRPR